MIVAKNNLCFKRDFLGLLTMIVLLISAVAGSFGQTSNELPMQRVTLTKRYSYFRFIKEIKNMHLSSGGISALLSLL